MIGKHCGERVVPHREDNPLYFKVRCVKCQRVFKQRKRQSAKKQK